MDSFINRWIKISFLNLLFVAFAGFILRYKILLPLSFIDQKHLLHGHSHFAFAGWITQTLMALMVAYLYKQKTSISMAIYKWLLIINLIAAYGMLISFPIQGYGAVSITFSTITIFISYIFSVQYWRDLDKLSNKSVVHLWFKAAMLFNVFSSIGTFGLAYMMANKMAVQNLYLGAVYYYLHFQYNGWFLFVCIGLFLSELISIATISKKELNTIFWLFALTCVPTYFLSALWLPIPLFVYILVVIASFVQVFAWFWLLKIICKNRQQIISSMSLLNKWMFALCTLALTMKLLLQLASTIPSLSTLTIGFRPIVIAYLHLVLLGVISIFLLSYIFFKKYVALNKTIKVGVIIFIGGIILNELILMLQGIAALSYNSLPFTNEMLLVAAIVMFSGIFLMLFSQINFAKNQKNSI